MLTTDPIWQASVSFFADIRSPAPVTRAVTWGALCKALSRFRKGETKDAIPLWSPCSYPEGTERRSKSAVQDVSLLVLDYDDGISILQAHHLWQSWPHLIHTSWSHRTDHPKFRVVVPLERPVPGEMWGHAFEWAKERSPGIDEKCSDASRVFYLPSHPPGAAHFVEVWDEPSQMLDLLEVAEKGAREAAEREQAFARQVADNQRASRQANESWQKDQGGQVRAAMERLATDQHARHDLALRMGASITAGNTKATFPCPSCGRTAYFLLPPGKMTGASCNHRNSCGWHGTLYELATMAGGVS